MNELMLRNIEKKIYVIRGQRVMLDSDLAELYGVETSALNRQVKRNLDRFPVDFMYQLTKEEYESLRCQIGISNEGRGGRRYQPQVFTENGVAMLSSVLSSKRAISVNIAIMRIFTKLRSFMVLESDLSNRMNGLEHDTTTMFKVVFQKLDGLNQRVGELDKLLPAHSADRKKIGLKPHKDK